MGLGSKSFRGLLAAERDRRAMVSTAHRSPRSPHYSRSHRSPNYSRSRCDRPHWVRGTEHAVRHELVMPRGDVLVAVRLPEATT